MPWFPRPRYLVPMIVACALFMENMDATVIATALPTIAHGFGESPLRLNLAITCYLLSLGIFLPLSGWLADRFGARIVFTSAIVVFTLGSIGCSTVESLPQLVLARIVQGMGGAMMVPVGRLVVLRSIPKAELVAAMAYLTVPALIGPVIGPPLGGFIVTYFSWRWIFWINIPIGLLGIALALRFVPNIREARDEALDGAGFGMVSLGLAGTMFGFENVGRGILSNDSVTALLVGGFFRSLQFTSLNTLAYADVEQPKMSRATTLASVGQQLSLSFGVGLGALLLHTTLAVRGRDALGAADFSPAYFTISAISLLSLLFFARLRDDAGAEISGNAAAAAAQAAAEAEPSE